VTCPIPASTAQGGERVVEAGGVDLASSLEEHQVRPAGFTALAEPLVEQRRELRV
jgi:hypothetical protein